MLPCSKRARTWNFYICRPRLADIGPHPIRITTQTEGFHDGKPETQKRAIFAPRGSRGLRSCGSYLERIRGPVIQAAGGAPGTGIPDCSGGTGRLLPNDCGREKRIGPTDIEERTQEPGTRSKDRNVYE